MKVENLNFPYKEFFIKIFGKNVFLVGGIIRDFFLYRGINKNKDIDLVVTSFTYKEIEKKLKSHGKVNTVGKSFAVIKFTKNKKTFDISIPRIDSKKDKNSSSHTNFNISSGKHVSLQQDLERRDFTCNSIALRLIDLKIFDPFKGIDAIKAKRLIMTNPDTFFQDPLRILRGARFASVHNFNLDKTIYLKAKEVSFAEVSAERICEELFGLLLKSPKPSLGLYEYFKLTVLEKIFPELYLLTLTIQDSSFHPEKDQYGHHSVWGHTCIAMDIAQKLVKGFKLSDETGLALLLAVLLHDVGKALTTKWEFKNSRLMITSVRHDSIGAQIAGKILTDLKIETKNNFPLKKTIVNLIKYHHRIFELYRNREKINFRVISRLVRDMEGNDFLLLLLDQADRISRVSKQKITGELDDISEWYLTKKEEWDINNETIKPLVRGRDLLKLGIEPGEKMGMLLNQLYDRQLDGEFKTRNQGISLFKKLKD